jgi:hypothetical protein
MLKNVLLLLLPVARELINEERLKKLKNLESIVKVNVDINKQVNN